MKLQTYLDATNQSIGSFAQKLKKPHETARRYAKGERIPEPDVMALITKTTGGLVTANDFYMREVAASAASDAA